MSGIIWLASYPKSGNTWLRVFLANYISNAESPVPINDLPNYSLGDNNLLHYRDFTRRDPGAFSAGEIAGLRPQIHAWMARAKGHDVFVKTHNAVLRIDGCPLVTPEATAGAIYVVRNPLDVAVSFGHHYRMPLERAVSALCNPNFQLLPSDDHLTQYLSSWSHHLRSWTEAPGLTHHVLRYEDMLVEPGAAFGAVVAFLGLPPEPERLARAIAFSRFEELARQEQQQGFIESRPGEAFFRTGRAGIWRGALSEQQVETLIAAHGPAMRTFGYLDEAGRPLG